MVVVAVVVVAAVAEYLVFESEHYGTDVELVE